MRTAKTTGRTGEEGAVLLIVAIALVTLLAIAALVIDLGAVRSNRAASLVAADAASTAGALDAAEGDGRAGCETALDYLELNLSGVGTLSGASCLGFPTSCDASTPSTTTTGTSGDWTVTLTYPVPDAAALLDPSAIGASGQAISTDDGDPCERFGVSITSNHEHLFASIIGAASQDTTVSSVAKTFIPPSEDFALNLLILERYDCDTITAAGSGGGLGGIVVDAVLNTDTGELDPGYIAIDSDASGVCGGDGVLDVDGSNAYIRADGPTGCDTETGTHVGPGGLTVGEGCGALRLLAPGTPGCNYPACTSSGTVSPDPSAGRERITRAPVDHRFNCKAAYPMPVGWEIDPCTDAPAPHIDNLVAAYGGTGTPTGFTSWTGAGYPCSIEGGPGTEIIAPAGNWHIDCDPFEVKRTVVFPAGDVIFDGDVVVEASGVLALNSKPAGGYPYSPDSDAAIAYMRNGNLIKAGEGSVFLYNTMMYYSASSGIAMSGGTGALTWTGPQSGNFEALSMWSESPAVHQLAGQAALDLEGVFFAPWARVVYRGNGSQEQVAAQFVSRTLSSEGQGLLVVRPNFDRAVLFPADPDTQLIR